MSRAKWNQVQIIGIVDDKDRLQLKAKPPKDWLTLLWEEVRAWVWYILGFLSGAFIGALWN